MTLLEEISYDPRDPNPWLALYLDESTPIADSAKSLWLLNSKKWSRQFLLPVVRPVSRFAIILTQLLKMFAPKWSSSTILHKILSRALSAFVAPEANLLVLRHFHIGSEVLQFIADNVPGIQMTLNPLKPKNLADVRDHLFLKHDLNLYNFIIQFNQQLREKKLQITPPPVIDFSAISETSFDIDPMPKRWANFLDLETAIEIFTPVYQFFLTDNDFWRASNSLQLDETIGIYVSRLLQIPYHLILVNNKHPMVAEPTLAAGHRLVLHGLSSEMLHALLVEEKRKQETGKSS